MRELAAYYAYLPRLSGQTSATDLRSRIVTDGEPMRRIAGGACHGELASKPGAPWLAGQPLIYHRLHVSDFPCITSDFATRFAMPSHIVADDRAPPYAAHQFVLGDKFAGRLG
jgi:hypothetical protein